MRQLIVTRTLQLIGGITLWCFVPITVAKAQITSDGTLSTNVNTSDGLNFTIDNGNQAGNNLFHSFREFSVPTNGAVFFDNALDVKNIFSRVTGGNISKIDGLIRANGAANLFLINPSGIIFGPEASLNIGGSFLASTANSLVFDGGIEFSATNVQATPLLSVNIPIGLRFRESPGSIINQSTVQVQPGKSLMLVGGDVNLDSGILLAPGGRVELGGVAEAGTVALNVDGNNLSLSFPDGVARADVMLTTKAEVNVRAGGGGSIAINAQNLELIEGSTVKAGIAPEAGSAGSKAGDIEINAQGAISVSDPGSFISNSVLDNATGKGGDIRITARSLSVTNGGQLAASTFGRGDAGNIDINVQDMTLFDGTRDGLSSGAYSRVELSQQEGLPAEGNGGSISLTTSSLSVTNGARLEASTEGKGNAGSVNINVRDAAYFQGEGPAPNFLSSAAYSRAETKAEGNGGRVNIEARNLTVSEGAVISASSDGRGIPGIVNINVSDTTIFNGVGSFNDQKFQQSSGAFSSVKENNSELGENGSELRGSVNLTTGTLHITNGASLFTSTLGKGNAGNVTINVRDTAFLDGVGPDYFPSGVYSRVETGAIGQAGNVNITASTLRLTNGAVLTTSTDGQGKAGNVIVNARDIFLDGEGNFNPTTKFAQSSGAFSSVKDNGIGEGGNIHITAESLSLSNGAAIVTSTLGKGNAGNVTINVRDTAFLDGVGPDYFPSGVYSRVETEAIGQAGNVNITVSTLRLTNGAVLTTSTDGQGKAGNVIVNARNIFLDGEGNFNPTTKFAQSSGAFSSVKDNGIGEGGNIHITAESLRVTNGAALVTSTLGQGNAGNVSINVRNTASFDGLGVDLFPSGAYSRVETPKAVGRGGNINITADTLSLTNGAVIGVNSQGQGNAGEIGIQADLVTLNREAFLSAETETTEGGNINLQTGSLQLYQGSNISTSAGTARAGGNGGNITIGTQTLVGLKNSDITANAFQGQGGRIEINAEGVFGLKARTREELQTQLGSGDLTEFDSRQLLSSDITAISQQGGPQLQGSVQIITPDADPSSGLIELPQTIVDPDALIALNPCTLGKGSEFIITGRGGLPPSPSEALSGRTVRVSLVEPAQPSTTGSNTATIVRSARPDSFAVVPAQGWILNEKGQLVFTAYDPTGTGSNRLERNPLTCPTR